MIFFWRIVDNKLVFIEHIRLYFISDGLRISDEYLDKQAPEKYILAFINGLFQEQDFSVNIPLNNFSIKFDDGMYTLHHNLIFFSI